MTAPSQLSAHGGTRIDLPGAYGPIAALRGADPPGNRPAATALLLPGYTGSKEDFAPLLDEFSSSGLRAIAVDLPGQYESGGPDDERSYLPAALGEVIAGLVNSPAVPDPVVLLGHSYGGLVARGAVLAGADIAGLTLMDTGPGNLPEGMRRDALLAGEPLMRSHGAAAVYDVRERLTAELTGHRPGRDRLGRFLRERFVTSQPAALLGMAHGLRYEPDRVDELARAMRRGQVPGLVVAGERDDAWSVASQRDMAERLDVPFRLIDNAGHSPNTESPKGLLNILLPTWHEWLR